MTGLVLPIIVILLQVTLLALAQAVAAGQSGPGPFQAFLYSPFSAVAASSVFFRYVLYDSNRRARSIAVFVALLALAVGTRSAAGDPTAFLKALAGLGGLGVAGFLSAAARARDRFERRCCIRQLAVALVLPVAASVTLFGLWKSASVNPVYDAHVYAFEEKLGFQFSLLGVRSFHAAAPLSALAAACYVAPALGIAFVAARQTSITTEVQIVFAAFAMGLVGYALYYVCPVVGPLTAFGPPYPATLPALSSVPIRPMIVTTAAPRNGMPSLHTAWALLVWLNSAPLDASWRRPLRVFVALTLWAVMGLDDTHWLMDVVVAVPLVVAVQFAIVTPPRSSPRLVDIALCAAAVASWLVAFRHPALLLRAPTPIAWAAVLATVAVPMYRQRRAYEVASSVGSRSASLEPRRARSTTESSRAATEGSRNAARAP